MAAPGEPVFLSLYIYQPNKGAPIFFTIVFALSSIFHIWQCCRYQAWKLIGLHPVCAVLFTAGYALRAYGAFGHYVYLESSNVPLLTFVMSQVFIYVGPPLLELANYHVLGRVFYYVPHCATYQPSKVLRTFGGLMILVELLNSLGVALSTNSSSSPTQQTLGVNLTIAAVSLQIFVILFFAYLAARFHRNFSSAGLDSKNVNKTLITLYLSMSLILVRCIYRLIEHTGHTVKEIDNMEALRELSPLLRYEVFFYIFEATLMLLNSVMWNVMHPGRLLPRSHRIYLARNGAEVEGKDAPDDRSIGAKIGNVLTFGVFFGRKRETQGFHELSENLTSSRSPTRAPR